MTPKQFLKRMADPRLNLAELARQTGINERALRRLRNSPPATPRQATMDTIVPHLMECKR